MSVDTPDQGSAHIPGYPSQLASEPSAVTGDRARAVFGHVMGLVALTVGCVALGAYIGRDLAGGAGIAFFIGAFVCIIALNLASARGREQLATALLFGLGLLLGLAVGPVINDYANADPAALWQAAGATAAFVAILGAVGYATRRDLSSWARTLFWALIALVVFGTVAIFVSIACEPHLRNRRTGDLRRVHDLRLQPAPAHRHRKRGPDRGEHLPRHLQRLPVHVGAVQRQP